MFNKVKILQSEQETFLLGFDLAKELPDHSCLLISGPLGAGKTQLVKGFCHYFGIPSDEVQSPTYSLHHSYSGKKLIHHFDLYRLNSLAEFVERGFLDHLQESGPVLIEWPSKIDTSCFRHRSVMNLELSILENGSRKIEIRHG